MAEKMDRGSDALKSHVADIDMMDIRQTRRGFCQEILGCEARTEFKYFIGETQVAHSLEDSDCCCRLFCAPIHPFTMAIKELNTDSEMITVERPFRCAMGSCKCCCYQSLSVNSGGQMLGSLQEDCWYCVPAFTLSDANSTPVYKIHPPTCCGGCCVNCFTEGNPCGKGCCKVPFRIYPADQDDTGGDAHYVGKILKKPKSLLVEILTDANAFEVSFPKSSTVAERGLIIGTSVLLNAVFFEGKN